MNLTSRTVRVTSGVMPINGVNLAYDDQGDGDRTVLLIHGHPFNRTMWTPQAAVLSANRRVLVPDLRGYGRSSLPAGSRETRLETFASDNLALMDALGIHSFALAGLSMGGQIALEMYRQAPERIEALLLADTFAGLDTPERKQLRLTTADRLEREGMEAYANEELTKMITADNARHFPNVAAQVIEMMTTTPRAGAAAALRGRAQRRDYLPLLKEIRVPATIVVGREDWYTPVAMAQQLRDGISGSELVVIEGAGHIPNLERPEAFNKVLESWLIREPLGL
jgi:3-oxoadipate enol-lactonase